MAQNPEPSDAERLIKRRDQMTADRHWEKDPEVIELCHKIYDEYIIRRTSRQLFAIATIGSFISLFELTASETSPAILRNIVVRLSTILVAVGSLIAFLRREDDKVAEYERQLRQCLAMKDRSLLGKRANIRAFVNDVVRDFKTAIIDTTTKEISYPDEIFLDDTIFLEDGFLDEEEFDFSDGEWTSDDEDNFLLGLDEDEDPFFEGEIDLDDLAGSSDEEPMSLEELLSGKKKRS